MRYVLVGVDDRRFDEVLKALAAAAVQLNLFGAAGVGAGNGNVVMVSGTEEDILRIVGPRAEPK